MPTEALELGPSPGATVRPSAPPEAPSQAGRFALVLAMFFVSGATGLLYEVAFSKMLGYVFGATAYAVSTVLASFMAGLALGAHVGGRFAGKLRRPLAAYGVLEILVGLVCVVSPATFDLVTRAYVGVAAQNQGSIAVLTFARAAITVAVVVVPTIAMGATLPVLSRWLSSDAAGAGAREAITARLPVLYAINTAGGAMGALLGAYLVLAALGIRGTMLAAATANFAIGAAALLAGLRGPAIPPEAAEERAADEPGESTSEGRIHLTLAFLSGFLVFATEVVQTHLLALLIGNSAYAFGLMLAVFLVCLSIGAARSPGLAKRWGGSALALGLALSGAALVLLLPVWDQLPWAFAFFGKHVHGWYGREVCRGLVAFGILSIPTLFMGTTFPLLLARVARKGQVARSVGTLTVANTVGTICGSVATGYFILPALGSEKSLIAIAFAFGLATLVATRLGDASRKASNAAVGLATAAVVLTIVLPRWDIARLTSGANVYFVMGPRPEAIEFVREDVHGGVTTVARRGAVRTMYTNGKFQGDDGGEMAAQRHFAHFPSLFLKKEDRALVIGLGTGVTLGTVAAYPWKEIVAAEISPAIVDAAKIYYDGVSLGALRDPRVKMELNDGRNVLLVSPKTYDLVTIELSSIWFAGSSNLYSREFYELVRSRLEPGGVFQQWIQLHHIYRRELATVIRTLRLVFPHVAFFEGGGQGIIVASLEPLVASKARIQRLDASPEIRRALDHASLLDLLGELRCEGADLDRFVRDAEADGGALVSTDDNLYLEYATPKGNVMNYHASLKAVLEMMEPYRTKDPSRLVGP